MLRLQQLDCIGATGLATAAPARRGAAPLGEQLVPHAAHQVLKAGGPARQPSTLDAGLQRLALATLRQQLAELAGRNMEVGAIVVLDNASGEVLAWVGSSGDYSNAPQVGGVLAGFQPGPTLKPFVYGLAIEQRLITPATLLDDAPTQINPIAGRYLPQNYDRQLRGWVSAPPRRAPASTCRRCGWRHSGGRMRWCSASTTSAWRCPSLLATTATRWRWAASKSRCWA